MKRQPKVLSTALAVMLCAPALAPGAPPVGRVVKFGRAARAAQPIASNSARVVRGASGSFTKAAAARTASFNRSASFAPTSVGRPLNQPLVRAQQQAQRVSREALQPSIAVRPAQMQAAPAAARGSINVSTYGVAAARKQLDQALAKSHRLPPSTRRELGATILTNEMRAGQTAAARRQAEALAAARERGQTLLQWRKTNLERAAARAKQRPALQSGLEKRGYRPQPGERTRQGVVERAIREHQGNPTVFRGGQQLYRLRSKGHGFPTANVTPRNGRNVAPGGKVHPKQTPARPITNRDIRELHKAQTRHSTSEIIKIKTRKGSIK